MERESEGAAPAREAGAVAAPLSELTVQRRIEFADTDLSGLVHFSRYFVFMETAEHQFLASVGATVHTTRDGIEVGWPRVSASCDYLGPIGFGDELEIRVRVIRKGAKSITWGHTFTHDGREVARGRVTSVCCVVNDPEGLRAIEMPRAIAERIAEAGPEESDG